jgi:hypothetical protein
VGTTEFAGPTQNPKKNRNTNERKFSQKIMLSTLKMKNKPKIHMEYRKKMEKNIGTPKLLIRTKIFPKKYVK